VKVARTVLRGECHCEVMFLPDKYSNIKLPNREKIIVNMQVDDEDFECLLDVCSNNGIGIDELKNATFLNFRYLMSMTILIQ
jgi:hypothetical protein